MESVVLLLGSNDVEAAAIVEQAIEALRSDVGKIVRISAEYHSEAYGFTSDREFINRCVELHTEYDAYEVLHRINAIEARLGRNREQEREVQAAMGERYASRPIDIDIIFYGDKTFSDERLTIPYHFLDERLYALRPLVEIAPDRKHPALTLTPHQMLERAEANE